MIADAGMDARLKTSDQITTTSLDEINAITPSKPTPNVWTVMQKWVFALPTTNEIEVKRKKVLQRELERTVADLGDKLGLGGNGVGPSTFRRRHHNFLLSSLLACLWTHGPP